MANGEAANEAAEAAVVVLVTAPLAAAKARQGLAEKLPNEVGGKGRLTGGVAAAAAAAAAAAKAEVVEVDADDGLPRPNKAAWKDMSLFLSSRTTGLTGMAGFDPKADDVTWVEAEGLVLEVTGVCHGLLDLLSLLRFENMLEADLGGVESRFEDGLPCNACC